ncbi:hypothetical protein VTO42DRAFT_3370 [Malbranchea cinnamomea]
MVSNSPLHSCLKHNPAFSAIPLRPMYGRLKLPTDMDPNIELVEQQSDLSSHKVSFVAMFSRPAVCCLKIHKYIQWKSTYQS